MDESGSMDSIRESAISSFNEFLQDQRKIEGDCTLSLVTFNTQYKVVYDFKKLSEIEPLTRSMYVPNGGTALLGAMGLVIDETGKRLNSLPESLRPDKVVFVTVTDGEENSTPHTYWGSQYNASNVKEKVEHQRSKYNWQYLYLGANQDSILVARNLGIQSDFAANFNATAKGSHENVKMFSGKLGSYRASGNSANLAYTDEDRSSLANSK